MLHRSSGAIAWGSSLAEPDKHLRGSGPKWGHLAGQEGAARAGSLCRQPYDDGAVFRVDNRDLQVNKLELHQPAGIAVSGREVWVSAVDECC
jgi:hypothetical protein